MASTSLLLPGSSAAPLRSVGSALGAALLILAAAGSAALLLFAVGDPLFAGAFAAGLIAVGALMLLRSRSGARPTNEALPAGTDIALLRAAIDVTTDAVAVTDANGRLLCANEAYASWFGGYATPPDLAFGEREQQRLQQAALAARRDGNAVIEQFGTGGARLRASQRQQLLQIDFINPRFIRDGKNRFAPLTITGGYQRDTTVGTRGVRVIQWWSRAAADR